MRSRAHVTDSATEVEHTSGAARTPRPLPRWAWPLALVSAAVFSLAGVFASPLQDAGWSSGAVVAVRIGGSALLLLVPALLAMRGKWHTLRRGLPVILGYGTLAIAGAQLCFFQAIQHMDVGIAVLIEYCSPLLLVGYMWVRHGKRPGPATIAGVVLAMAGLLLILDTGGAANVSLVGVVWASGAAVGLSAYFLLSADDAGGLPPMALAAAGMIFAATIIGIAGATGVLAMTFTTHDVVMAGATLPWWVPAVGLALVSGAIAYVTGIVITRALGAGLGSFVAYLELLGAFVFAWLLLGQLPTLMQVAGGVVLMAGIAAVKYGEDARRDPRPGRHHDTLDAHV